MIELDVSKFKTPAFAHQIEGVKLLLRHPAFAIFDEMGAGKSKQVIDTACVLANGDKIDTVVVLAPASVRSVWLDAETGEIRKHAWIPSRVLEFHSPRGGTRWREIWRHGERRLTWIVTNYEFIRSETNRSWLLKGLEDKKTFLVLDESSYVKNRASKQTHAAGKVRQRCSRVVLLNGTPVSNSPLDLWAQMMILDQRILGNRFKNFYQFKYHYAIMGGWHEKQVLGYKNLEELQQLVAPYAVRRLKADCLDLPPKLFTVREVALREETWKIYQTLRRHALVALTEAEEKLEPNAAVRIVRLAQLTSGIIGGLSVDPAGELDFVEEGELSTDPNVELTKDVSREKLDWVLAYLKEETSAKSVIVWCRFRRERERLAKELRDDRHSPWSVAEIYGGQAPASRSAALALMKPTNTTAERVVLVAQPKAGGFGLDLTRATEAVYLSNDFSLTTRLQSIDRPHRPGQQHAVTYVDVLATGPKGQRTIDHTIRRALGKMENLAAWTASVWRRALSEEE